MAHHRHGRAPEGKVPLEEGVIEVGALAAELAGKPVLVQGHSQGKAGRHGRPRAGSGPGALPGERRLGGSRMGEEQKGMRGAGAQEGAEKLRAQGAHAPPPMLGDGGCIDSNAHGGSPAEKEKEG